MTQQKKKVLLIDDESDVRDILKMVIETGHFHCLTASSAVEGRNIAIRKKPDLILLDLMMPEMSGFGFLREREKHAELKKIPVVVLTSLGDEEVAREALSLGAVGYLIKSCGKEELMAMIQEYA